MPTLAQKIIRSHLRSGNMQSGEDITVTLDQCLLQDATGTMAWLEYEGIGAKKVKPFTIQYIDHNVLQVDNKNMDDHLFLMTMTSKFGAHLSLPGNGISHHVHKERFTKPGQLMIGSDSHTPTSGGSAMIAIGVGGMDVAVGLATGEFSFRMPEIVGIKLTGKLPPWSTAKDVILELLRQVDVDGGKGKIWEFFGPGVKTLDVSERSTIGNMGAETGATTTIFPSDQRTKEFFSAQNRVQDFVPLSADRGAEYDDIIEIDLGKVEPLIACPYSPGKVKAVRELAGVESQQTIIGSSTNSSYREVMRCAHMIEKAGKHNKTYFNFLPGSRQLVETLHRDGGLIKLIRAGTRISEPSCNACIGIGNAPGTDVVSVRSFPRNWEGRSGTEHDQVYLSSPETATATAIKGEITDPRDLGMRFPAVKEPKKYVINDNMVVTPTYTKEIRRGPNIKKLHYRTSIPANIRSPVLITLSDDISTDHILRGGEEIMSLRSNIPAISEYTFHYIDREFVSRAKQKRNGCIVAGDNYGQGSSREHAAIAPMFLGIQVVLAKSFARIHRSNLINFGILPLEFVNKKDHKSIKQHDILSIKNLRSMLQEKEIPVFIGKKKILARNTLTKREKDIFLNGGLLNYTKKRLRKNK